MPETEKSPNRYTPTARITAALAGTALVFGGVKYGPELWEAMRPGESSQIVAGVPGQVESHYADRSAVSIKPLKFKDHYWIGVEQCASDVIAAEQGKQTISYDLKVGEISKECTFDLVEVSPQTYADSQVGASIVFQGDTGDHLRK